MIAGDDRNDRCRLGYALLQCDWSMDKMLGGNGREAERKRKKEAWVRCEIRVCFAGNSRIAVRQPFLFSNRPPSPGGGMFLWVLEHGRGDHGHRSSAWTYFTVANSIYTHTIRIFIYVHGASGTSTRAIVSKTNANERILFHGLFEHFALLIPDHIQEFLIRTRAVPARHENFTITFLFSNLGYICQYHLNSIIVT